MKQTIDSSNSRLTLRIPPDIKEWLEGKSKYLYSSMNSLIVQALRKAKEEEEQKTDKAPKTAKP